MPKKIIAVPKTLKYALFGDKNTIRIADWKTLKTLIEINDVALGSSKRMLLF